MANHFYNNFFRRIFAVLCVVYKGLKAGRQTKLDVYSILWGRIHASKIIKAEQVNDKRLSCNTTGQN